MEAENRNRKEYSKPELIFGNLAIIFWISLGAAVCGIFYPLAAAAFFALVAFLIFFEVGKHGCVTCYYCKTCTIGMGKLPELFFKQKGTANVNRRALKLFPLVYVLLSLIPVALLVFSLIQELVFYKLVLLTGILIFSAYTGIVRRKNLI
ncbi:MAG: hypothetical protein ACM3WQ_02720 [Chloroflexota bacterium]|nr:hypothetical protein [Candidatus Sulfotelmatobacter sp.]